MSDEVKVPTTTEEEAEICTFILEGAPLMYYGELFYNAEDHEKNKLVFKKALIKVEDMEKGTAKWLRPPTAGKESLVVIDTRTVRGILIKNIDPKEVKGYKDALLKLYSGLHLA